MHYNNKVSIASSTVTDFQILIHRRPGLAKIMIFFK